MASCLHPCSFFLPLSLAYPWDLDLRKKVHSIIKLGALHINVIARELMLLFRVQTCETLMKKLHMDCSESNKYSFSSGNNKPKNEWKGVWEFGIGIGTVKCFNATQNNRVLNYGSSTCYWTVISLGVKSENKAQPCRLQLTDWAKWLVLHEPISCQSCSQVCRYWALPKHLL